MAAAVGKAAVAAYGHGESGGGRGGGFLGPRVPAEVEAMARGVQEVGKETFRRLLKGRARARPVLGVRPGLLLPRGSPVWTGRGSRRLPRGNRGSSEEGEDSRGICSPVLGVGRAAALLGRFSGSESRGLNTSGGFS